ncbi:MAG TPA: RidA family protein [Candidatus Dormibacteraeota bacterium]|nr:RidA family protein [Candidatus Dormibacteraeota bacterium]
MTLQLVQSDQLPTADSYSQIVVATGKRLVFVAGQVAEDSQGNLIGDGDLAVQARQAFGNVGRALAATGAAPEQVARITIYVVHYKPADTLVGVEALAEPQHLIEIDAIAVVD